MPSQSIRILAALAVMSALTTPSFANEDAVKYRKGVMSAIGGTMGSLAAVLKGKAPMSHAPALSNAMAQLSMVVPDIFPAGSDSIDSRAKEEIWTQKEKFATAVKTFQAAAMNISKASGDKASFGEAFKALGAACGGCHKPFREPKN